MSTTRLRAGALRHRITIERQQQTQDQETGAVSNGWTTLATDVPASVEPLSGKDFIRAAQLASAITARITIRYRPDVDTNQRIRHDATTYIIKAALPDPNSGREWLTLLVESR